MNDASSNSYLTLQQTPSANDIVKFGELCEVKESIPLKLADRRAINTLILSAWDDIAEKDKEHRISKRELRGPADTGSNPTRLDGTLSRLQICQLKMKIQRDGKSYTKSVSLLRSYAIPDDGTGDILYEFEPEMVAMFQTSTHWGRLERSVILHFRSRYSLSLYELLMKRIRLKWKWKETFDVAELRSLLGVPDGKLKAYKTFKQKVLTPAFLEVNGLSNIDCQYLEIKEGRKVTSIEIAWRTKDEDGLKQSYAERKRPRLGRKARLSGEVETVA